MTNEQLLEDLKRYIDGRLAQTESRLNGRIDDVETRLKGIDARLLNVESKLAAHD